jgi:hypothetical protein
MRTRRITGSGRLWPCVGGAGQDIRGMTEADRYSRRNGTSDRADSVRYCLGGKMLGWVAAGHPEAILGFPGGRTRGAGVSQAARASQRISPSYLDDMEKRTDATTLPTPLGQRFCFRVGPVEVFVLCPPASCSVVGAREAAEQPQTSCSHILLVGNVLGIRNSYLFSNRCFLSNRCVLDRHCALRNCRLFGSRCLRRDSGQTTFFELGRADAVFR